MSGPPEDYIRMMCSDPVVIGTAEYFFASQGDAVLDSPYSAAEFSG